VGGFAAPRLNSQGEITMETELETMRTDKGTEPNRNSGGTSNTTNMFDVCDKAFIALGAQFPTGKYKTHDGTVWFTVEYICVTKPQKVELVWTFFAKNNKDMAYLVVDE